MRRGHLASLLSVLCWGTPAVGAEGAPASGRSPGLVLESSLGAFAPLGHFRRVSPPGPTWGVLFGIEPARFFLAYVSADLRFADTSIAQDETKARAFPLVHVSLGLRPKVHVSRRVALYAQAAIGAMKGDVPRGALALLGYPDAETLNLTLGGKLGVEWYHGRIALGFGPSLLHARGLRKATSIEDVPVLLEGGVSLRYGF